MAQADVADKTGGDGSDQVITSELESKNHGKGNDENNNNKNNPGNKASPPSNDPDEAKKSESQDTKFENVLNSIDTIKDDEDLKVKLRKQKTNLILECVEGGSDGVFDILTDKKLVGASKGVGRIVARALVKAYPKQQSNEYGTIQPSVVGKLVKELETVKNKQNVLERNVEELKDDKYSFKEIEYVVKGKNRIPTTEDDVGAKFYWNDAVFPDEQDYFALKKEVSLALERDSRFVPHRFDMISELINDIDEVTRCGPNTRDSGNSVVNDKKTDENGEMKLTDSRSSEKESDERFPCLINRLDSLIECMGDVTDDRKTNQNEKVKLKDVSNSVVICDKLITYISDYKSNARQDKDDINFTCKSSYDDLLRRAVSCVITGADVEEHMNRVLDVLREKRKIEEEEREAALQKMEKSIKDGTYVFGPFENDSIEKKPDMCRIDVVEVSDEKDMEESTANDKGKECGLDESKDAVNENKMIECSCQDDKTMEIKFEIAMKMGYFNAMRNLKTNLEMGIKRGDFKKSKNDKHIDRTGVAVSISSKLLTEVIEHMRLKKEEWMDMRWRNDFLDLFDAASFLGAESLMDEIAALLAREIWGDAVLSVPVKCARSDSKIDGSLFTQVICWIIGIRKMLLEFVLKCLGDKEFGYRELVGACNTGDKKLRSSMCGYLHCTRVEHIAPTVGPSFGHCEDDVCFLQLYEVTTTTAPGLEDKLVERFSGENIVSGYIRENESQEHSSFTILMELRGWHGYESIDKPNGFVTRMINEECMKKNKQLLTLTQQILPFGPRISFGKLDGHLSTPVNHWKHYPRYPDYAYSITSLSLSPHKTPSIAMGAVSPEPSVTATQNVVLSSIVQ